MKLKDFIAGLMIIAKYAKEEHCIAAEHDQFWAGDGSPMTTEDEARMVALGWFLDEDMGWSVWT